jgi:hypothetical protein
MAELHNIELYFECVPWYKGIESTLVHPGMSVDKILEVTRWYDMSSSTDGYMDLEPDPELGPEDDAGRNVPLSIILSREVSTPQLGQTDPPWPGNRELPRAVGVWGRTSPRSVPNIRMRFSSIPAVPIDPTPADIVTDASVDWATESDRATISVMNRWIEEVNTNS